jgi:hypothetical protein
MAKEKATGSLHDHENERQWRVNHFWPCEMAVNSYILSFERIYMLKRLGLLCCRVDNKLSCDCPGGCRGTISYLSAYKGSQNLVFRCL